MGQARLPLEKGIEAVFIPSWKGAPPGQDISVNPNEGRRHQGVILKKIFVRNVIERICLKSRLKIMTLGPMKMPTDFSQCMWDCNLLPLAFSQNSNQFVRPVNNVVWAITITHINTAARRHCTWWRTWQAEAGYGRMRTIPGPGACCAANKVKLASSGECNQQRCACHRNLLANPTRQRT